MILVLVSITFIFSRYYDEFLIKKFMNMYLSLNQIFNYMVESKTHGLSKT